MAADDDIVVASQVWKPLMVIPCTFAGAPWTAKPAFEYNFAQLVFEHALLYVRAHFSGMQAAHLTKIVIF